MCVHLAKPIIGDQLRLMISPKLYELLPGRSA